MPFSRLKRSVLVPTEACLESGRKDILAFGDNASERGDVFNVFGRCEVVVRFTTRSIAVKEFRRLWCSPKRFVAIARLEHCSQIQGIPRSDPRSFMVKLGARVSFAKDCLLELWGRQLNCRLRAYHSILIFSTRVDYLLDFLLDFLLGLVLALLLLGLLALTIVINRENGRGCQGRERRLGRRMVSLSATSREGRELQDRTCRTQLFGRGWGR
jgi:hypothetical protein